MQQFCPYGSVRGALGNQRPYRDKSPSVEGAASRFSLCETDLVQSDGPTCGEFSRLRIARLRFHRLSFEQLP